MTDTKQQPAPALSRLTTPTWEMELLVSGATIFGLLQLPSLLDRSYSHLFNNSSESFSMLLSAIWIYSKISLVTLIITFIVHLCLRGYWVALVGMDSVYRGGIRWDVLRMGPIARSVHRSESAPMGEAIEAADNRATRVFGTGFGIAMVMLVPIALVCIAMVVSLAMDATFGPAVATWSFVAVVGVVLAPFLVATAIDRASGHRLVADGIAARLLRALLRGYARIGLDGSSNRLIGLFVSHEGYRRARWMASLFVVPILLLILVSTLGPRLQLQFGSTAGWPLTDPHAARSSQPAFYDDLHSDRLASRPVPYIGSRVSSGPYLPLFIPFIPRAHVPAMTRHCPSLTAVDGPPESGAALDCLARLSDVRIDGVAVPVAFEASTDPKTAQRGVLAMLPVASLRPGRHELSLYAPARKIDRDKPPRRYRIPFWR